VDERRVDRVRDEDELLPHSGRDQVRVLGLQLFAPSDDRR
jgi:hypothetical protein